MNFKRIGRSLICLLLVCVLLINASPIKTEASVIATTAVTSAGLLSWLFAAGMGVVFTDLTVNLLNGMGESMSAYPYQWGTSAEKLDEVEEFLTLLPPVPDNPDDGDDGDDGDGDGGDEEYTSLYEIPGTILGGLLEWAKCLINGDGVEVERETVDGFCVYNANEFFDFSVGTSSYSRSVDVPYSVIGFMGYLDNGSQYLSSVFVCSNTAGHVVQNYSSLRFSESHNCYYNRLHFTSGQGGPYPITGNFPVIDLGNSVTTLIDYDAITTEYACSWFVNGSKVSVYPDTYVGDIPQQVQDGTFEEEKYELPYINYSQLFQGQTDAVEALNNVATQLQNQTMTYEQYMELIQPQPAVEPDPEPEPTEEDIPVVAPDLDSDTLANVNPNSFLEQLGAIILSPFKWIWGNIKTFFEPLLAPDTLLSPLPDILEVPFTKTWEYLQSIPQEIADASKELAMKIETIPDKLSELGTKIQAIPDKVSEAATQASEAVKESVEKLVVPEEDYITDKVDALRAEFAFADSIVRTANELKVGLAGVTTEPPVIYIDLGATRGSYDIGGEVPFLDLRWYSEYKGTVDAIISAFLWICFVWRMLLKLPGIISGMPGDFVMASAHNMGITDYLPSRSKEYEIQRISNREMIRKGPDK